MKSLPLVLSVAFVLCAMASDSPSISPLPAPDNKLPGRFLVTNGTYFELVPNVVTLRLDTATGRTWRLAVTAGKPSVLHWQPIAESFTWDDATNKP